MLGLVGGAPGGGDTARRSREGLDDRLGEGFGRLRVLASDELSALRDDDVRRPRVALAVLAALAREALLVRPRDLTAQSFRTRVDRASGNSELRRTKG